MLKIFLSSKNQDDNGSGVLVKLVLVEKTVTNIKYETRTTDLDDFQHTLAHIFRLDLSFSLRYFSTSSKLFISLDGCSYCFAFSTVSMQQSSNKTDVMFNVYFQAKKTNKSVLCFDIK